MASGRLLTVCVCCRYMYTHKVNATLNELVEAISPPWVRNIMKEYMHLPLDAFPTPADYAHIVGSGVHDSFEHPMTL